MTKKFFYIHSFTYQSTFSHSFIFKKLTGMYGYKIKKDLSIVFFKYFQFAVIL